MQRQKNIVPLLMALAGIALIGTITAATVQTSLFGQNQQPPVKETTGQNSNQNPPQNPNPGQSIQAICQDALKMAIEFESELKNIITNLKETYPKLDLKFLDKNITDINQKITNLKSAALNCGADAEEKLGTIINDTVLAFEEVYKKVAEVTAATDLAEAHNDFRENVKPSCVEKEKFIKELKERIDSLKLPNLGNIAKLSDRLNKEYKNQCVEFITKLQTDLEKKDITIYWEDSAVYWPKDENFWKQYDAIISIVEKLEEEQAKLIDIKMLVDEAQESHKNKKDELEAIIKEVAELGYTGAKSDIKKLGDILALGGRLIKDAISTLEQKNIDKTKTILDRIENQVEKPWITLTDAIYKKLDSVKHSLGETKKIEVTVKDGESAIKKDLEEQKITAQQAKTCLDYVKRLKDQIAKVRKAVDAGRLEESQKLLEELKALWERAQVVCPSLASLNPTQSQ